MKVYFGNILTGQEVNWIAFNRAGYSNKRDGIIRAGYGSKGSSKNKDF